LPETLLTERARRDVAALLVRWPTIVEPYLAGWRDARYLHGHGIPLRDEYSSDGECSPESDEYSDEYSDESGESDAEVAAGAATEAAATAAAAASAAAASAAAAAAAAAQRARLCRARARARAWEAAVQEAAVREAADEAAEAARLDQAAWVGAAERVGMLSMSPAEAAGLEAAEHVLWLCADAAAQAPLKLPRLGGGGGGLADCDVDDPDDCTDAWFSQADGGAVLGWLGRAGARL